METGIGRAVITEADAEECRRIGMACARGEITKEERQRCMMARDMLQLYTTQNRYQLTPQTPAAYERAAKRDSQAQRLARTTPDELAAMREKMTGDYPGKGKVG